MSSATQLQSTPGCRVWIDGVGCWLIWFKDELVIGNASSGSSEEFRLRFPSTLSTRHALWQRDEGCDWLSPQGSCQLNQQSIQVRTRLYAGDELQLGSQHSGSQIKLKWNRPSPLSGSAVVELGGSRTADSLDGVILFDETCLIGNHPQAHLRCPRWEANWVLYRQGTELWGRNTDENLSWPVVLGEVRQSGDWQVRFESLPGTKF